MPKSIPLSTIRLLVFISPLFHSLTFAELNLTLPNFSISLAAGSAVLESLRPAIDPDFDFSPSDVFHLRNGPGQYHTGDLTFRYRNLDSGGTWLTADTATQRLSVISNTSTSAKGGMVTSNLNPALPNVTGIRATRTWRQVGGDLALSFTLTNTGQHALELGGLGLPIEMNNIFTDRTATETTAKCVFVDPYIGLNAGYAQVTRLTGKGPDLVISPLNSETKFEAWRFLTEPEDVPLGYQIQTFEGNYAWEVLSKAWAETEWKGAEPWNPPTSKILGAGEEVTVGLRFSVASGVQDIEDTVSAVGLPAAVGVPGFVLPYDLEGKLFLNTTQKIASMDIFPSGALQITPHSQIYGGGGTWQGYDITASSSAFGRTRLDVTYADNSTQAIHYWITYSSPEAISQLGGFLTNEQWFTNTSDPFGRAPGVITYDRHNETYVNQDNRTWIAGQSDEGGAGAFLAAGMKQAFYPVHAEVRKLEQMVHDVVWGTLQIDSGNESYAVRKSLFYYQPDLVPGYYYDPYFNWTINPGETWNKSLAYLTDRTYDYVHVSALYWGLYRSSLTYPGILTKQTPEWYLLQAYHTVVYACSNSTDEIPNTDYWSVGLMGERVWGYLLSDLYATNHTSKADHMRSLMKVRQQLWASEADPFGSEMAWDSTGEEGVYYWSEYFHDNATAQKSINAIRGYMPTIPHWGWNGNARRYWDFLYAGSIWLARIERQIHHYGSGLNALPMLANYRAMAEPESLEALYDLRVGYGGNQGPLSNIDSGGFGSMAFHSYPQTLHWDAYSGDYGPNFSGMAMGASTYLIDHPIFGWISFGGNANISSGVITVEPKDPVRKRIFVAAVSLWVQLDSGTIQNFIYDAKTKEVSVSIVGNNASKFSDDEYRSGEGEQAIMHWEQTAQRADGCKVELVTKGLKPRLGGLALHVPSTVKFVAS